MGMSSLHDSMKGLAELKDQQYIHRDLKPENILIDSKGTGKLTDFGTMVKNEGDIKKGQYAGTPKYSSPETAAIEKNSLLAVDVNEKSDVWSMGMVVQDMLINEGVASHPIWSSGLDQLSIHQRLSGLEAVYNERVPREIYNSALDKYVNAPANDVVKDLKKLIADCTQPLPADRPSIEEVTTRFGVILERVKQEPEKLYNPRGHPTLVA